MMETTPPAVIDSVVRSVCGRGVERLVRLTSGGMNETYRVEISNGRAVIVRIARQPVAWFTDEEHVIAEARVADPDTADGGWVPAFVLDFAFEKLAWKNPAPLEQLRRCVDVIAHYVGD